MFIQLLLVIRKGVNYKQNVNSLGEINSLTEAGGAMSYLPCYTNYFSHRVVESKAANRGISVLTQTKTTRIPVFILLFLSR